MEQSKQGGKGNKSIIGNKNISALRVRETGRVASNSSKPPNCATIDEHRPAIQATTICSWNGLT